MVIGLVGTRTFENKRKIKEFIFKLKEYKEMDITIIGMGDLNGADKHVKKYALELGFNYKELNPPHTTKNLYSIMSESYYEKPYSNRSMFLRNKIYCQYVEKCVIFDDSELKDKKIANLVKELARARKKAIIITS